MRGRPVLCGILLAHAVVVFAPRQPALSTWGWVCAGLVVLAGLCLLVRVAPSSAVLSLGWCRRVDTLAWTLLAASLALLLTAQRVWLRLDDALAPDDVDRVCPARTMTP